MSLNSISLQGMCVELILTYFFLFRAVLKPGHWKVNPRDRFEFGSSLFVEIKQTSRKT